MARGILSSYALTTVSLPYGTEILRIGPGQKLNRALDQEHLPLVLPPGLQFEPFEQYDSLKARLGEQVNPWEIATNNPTEGLSWDTSNLSVSFVNDVYVEVLGDGLIELI